jgi:predicted acetyltransferase
VSDAVLIRPVEPEDWAAVADIMAQPRVIWGTMQMPHASLAFIASACRSRRRGCSISAR